MFLAKKVVLKVCVTNLESIFSEIPYNGSWADGDPATNLKTITLSSADPNKEETAPAVVAPEGKEFSHWVSSNKVQNSQKFTLKYSDYEILTDYNVTDTDEVTWTAVYKDATPVEPEAPKAPVETDLPMSYIAFPSVPDREWHR